jgi:hypothetical protein
MRRQILATAAALVCAGALTAAQEPGNPGQQSDPARPGAAGAQAENRAGEQGTTTLTGCVYREESVPGRTPNVAERVGILEDYILAVSTGQGQSGAAVGTSGQASPGAAGQGRPGAADQGQDQGQDQDRADASPDRAAAATGTSGTSASGHSMFKLELIDDDKLQAMVGKRVEVMGKVDAEAGDRPAATSGARAGDADRSIGPDQIELPEFEVSSIREVAGDCPASPTSNQ